MQKLGKVRGKEWGREKRKEKKKVGGGKESGTREG
jgi:hypothetical protein